VFIRKSEEADIAEGMMRKRCDLAARQLGQQNAKRKRRNRGDYTSEREDVTKEKR